jgi:hypothetical protein
MKLFFLFCSLIHFNCIFGQITFVETPISESESFLVHEKDTFEMLKGFNIRDKKINSLEIASDSILVCLKVECRYNKEGINKVLLDTSNIFYEKNFEKLNNSISNNNTFYVRQKKEYLSHTNYTSQLVVNTSKCELVIKIYCDSVSQLKSLLFYISKSYFSDLLNLSSQHF